VLSLITSLIALEASAGSAARIGLQAATNNAINRKITGKVRIFSFMLTSLIKRIYFDDIKIPCHSPWVFKNSLCQAYGQLKG
jgi:hypothetical protein